MHNDNRTAQTQPIDKQWHSRFSELCYEVFYKNPHGAELLTMLEMKHFRSPVAFPGRDSSWAYFNEGQNEMIRSFTAAIQGFFMSRPKEPDTPTPRVVKPRKSITKPIK